MFQQNLKRPLPQAAGTSATTSTTGGTRGAASRQRPASVTSSGNGLHHQPSSSTQTANNRQGNGNTTGSSSFTEFQQQQPYGHPHEQPQQYDQQHQMMHDYYVPLPPGGGNEARYISGGGGGHHYMQPSGTTPYYDSRVQPPPPGPPPPHTMSYRYMPTSSAVSHSYSSNNHQQAPPPVYQQPMPLSVPGPGKQEDWLDLEDVLIGPHGAHYRQISPHPITAASSAASQTSSTASFGTKSPVMTPPHHMGAQQQPQLPRTDGQHVQFVPQMSDELKAVKEEKPPPPKRVRPLSSIGEHRLKIRFETYGSPGEIRQTYGRKDSIIPDGLCGRNEVYNEPWRFEIRHHKRGQRVTIEWIVTNLNTKHVVTRRETLEEAIIRETQGKTICNQVLKEALEYRATQLEAELAQGGSANADAANESRSSNLQSRIKALRPKRCLIGLLFFGLQHLTVQQHMKLNMGSPSIPQPSPSPSSSSYATTALLTSSSVQVTRSLSPDSSTNSNQVTEEDEDEFSNFPQGRGEQDHHLTWQGTFGFPSSSPTDSTNEHQRQQQDDEEDNLNQRQQHEQQELAKRHQQEQQQMSAARGGRTSSFQSRQSSANANNDNHNSQQHQQLHQFEHQ